jgi:hypothetical protein
VNPALRKIFFVQLKILNINWQCIAQPLSIFLRFSVFLQFFLSLVKLHIFILFWLCLFFFFSRDVATLSSFAYLLFGISIPPPPFSPLIHLKQRSLPVPPLKSPSGISLAATFTALITALDERQRVRGGGESGKERALDREDIERLWFCKICTEYI